jgi:hypothetical protein
MCVWNLVSKAKKEHTFEEKDPKVNMFAPTREGATG